MKSTVHGSINPLKFYIVSVTVCWVPKRSRRGRLNFMRKYIVNVLIGLFHKQICFRSFPAWERNAHCADTENLSESLLRFWCRCVTWKPPRMRGPPHRGEPLVVRSVGRDTSASFSLEDSKASELEHVRLRSLQVREAWAGGRYRQSGFYSGNLRFRQKKVPFAAVAPRLIRSRRYRLFWRRGSTTVLGCIGSECRRLPSYVYIKFFSAIIITRSLSSLDAF